MRISTLQREVSRIYALVRRVDPRVVGTFPRAQFARWIEAANIGTADSPTWRCGYCMATIRAGELSIDHQTPRSLGGPSTQDNLMISCDRCNRLKGSMTAAGYRCLLEALWKMSSHDAASVTRRLLSIQQRGWKRTKAS